MFFLEDIEDTYNDCYYETSRNVRHLYKYFR